MMKLRRVFIVWMIFAAAMTGNFRLMAQSARSLTIREAIDLSIKNSKQLKSNQAEIAEATAAIKEATDRRLPDFNITGSYLHLNSPHIKLKSTEDSTGNTGPKTSTPKVSQAMYGIANLSLPLYSGLRIQYGIESARYLELATKLDADKDREDIILNTINAFSNLFKAQSAVGLVQESLAQARQRVTDFSNLEKNGLLARNDLLKAELQASNTELTLLDAENNANIANVNMNLMLGLPEQNLLHPDTANIDLQVPADIKTISEWEQLALQNRKDVAALTFREKAAVTGVKSVKGELYPSIALTGGYIAAYVPNLLTITNAVNIGLGVQYNMGALWKNKAKVQQATARIQQVQAREEMLADNIRLQINQAYQNLLLSRKRIEVYQKSVLQATENYRITRNKYENSLVTTTDLLEADVSQLQAKLNATYTRTDALVSYTKLLHAAGLLNNLIEKK
jgi:outer membrane protein TolC